MEYPLVSDTYGDEEINGAIEILRSKRLTMGTRVNDFEKQFAQYVGTKYAVMVNSGSSANLLAFSVISNLLNNNNIPKNSEVLIPSVCWSTTYSPIIHSNFKPIFVDVDKTTLNIDIDDMKKKITPQTRAIILVHVMGNCTNMDKLMKIIDDFKLILIEDTCEALGSIYKYNGANKYLGTFGRFGTYSFYYSHHITTFEGGMIVCDGDDDYNMLKCLRAHGWTRDLTNRKEVEKKYNNIDNRFCFINYGYNFRPTEIQGGVGIIQLKKLKEKNDNRVYNYHLIKSKLMSHTHNKKFKFCNVCENSIPAWFSMCIFVETNNIQKYLEYLDKNGVENRPVISGNMVRQPVISMLHPDLNPEDFPNAEYVHNNGFLIGLQCEKITDFDAEKISNILASYYNTNI